jgi:hypothetical protein
LEKIKHGFKTLAECGGIRGVDDTSSSLMIWFAASNFYNHDLFIHMGLHVFSGLW